MISKFGTILKEEMKKKKECKWIIFIINPIRILKLSPTSFTFFIIPLVMEENNKKISLLICF